MVLSRRGRCELLQCSVRRRHGTQPLRAEWSRRTARADALHPSGIVEHGALGFRAGAARGSRSDRVPFDGVLRVFDRLGVRRVRERPLRTVGFLQLSRPCVRDGATVWRARQSINGQRVRASRGHRLDRRDVGGRERQQQRRRGWIVVLVDVERWERVVGRIVGSFVEFVVDRWRNHTGRQQLELGR